MSVKSLSAVLLTDGHTNDPTSYVNPLVRSVQDRLSAHTNICLGDNYAAAGQKVKAVQGNYDAILVFLRSGLMFKHPGLFGEFRRPVVVIEHDAYQNSLEWHSRYQAWTNFFRANPIAALCVSGNQALYDLRGKIPGIVKRIPKGAPESFLRTKINASGRYCVFGTVQFEVYTERKDVFDAI